MYDNIIKVDKNVLKTYAKKSFFSIRPANRPARTIIEKKLSGKIEWKQTVFHTNFCQVCYFYFALLPHRMCG